jgi:3,4-dihydroxy 2-butanone 4-phosphate synthase / GTP cyclohydrolase II
MLNDDEQHHPSKGVLPMASSRLPLKGYGDFNMTVFRHLSDDAEHFILEKRPFHGAAPLVRVHSECITGDLFGSLKCDCGEQLHQSLHAISREGGVLIYLRQEGRGIGLANKLKAYALQEQGFDTVEANRQLGLPVDSRDYEVAFEILKYLGIERIRLLTNNPEKIAALSGYGVVIEERISLESLPTEENLSYLKTKQEKLGHWLQLKGEST